MKKWIYTFLNVAAKFADWASILILAFITVQLIAVVILRYVFFTNIRWFEQSSTLLFVYLVFIPAGLLSRSSQHLNVEVLQEYLQKREKQKGLWLLHIALRLTEALFCALALYFSCAPTPASSSSSAPEPSNPKPCRWPSSTSTSNPP